MRALDVRHASGVIAHGDALATPEVLAGVGTELERALATGEARRMDRRIARLLDDLRDPAADRRTALARTRLSPAHLRALFVRDVGLPMRTYALWRRLGNALRYIDSLDMTATAHAAGFADLAHFSRTFRRMIGYSPTEFLTNLVATSRAPRQRGPFRSGAAGSREQLKGQAATAVRPCPHPSG